MEYTIEKKDYKIIKLFIKESLDNLADVETILLEKNVNKIHEIKMGSSFFGIKDISMLCFQIEGAFSEAIKEGNLLSNELMQVISKALLIMKNSFEFASKKFSYKNCLLSFEDSEEITNYKNKIEEILKKKNVEEVTVSNNLNLEELSTSISEDFKAQFVAETLEYIDKIDNELLLNLEKSREDFGIINEIFRCVHSIKGGAGIVISSLAGDDIILPIVKQISQISHCFESLLSIIRDNKLMVEDDVITLIYGVLDYLKICTSYINDDNYEEVSVNDIVENISEITAKYSKLPAKENIINSNKQEVIKNNFNLNNGFQTIRVSENKIEKMMNTIGELTIVKNTFMHFARTVNVEYNLPILAKEIKTISNSVNKISDDLQDAIMSIRMIEVKTIFNKMPKVVRDIAQINNKKINLAIEGEETEIDKTIVEQVSDPIVHIIRNAADHGIENSEERIKNGKEESGIITLRAYNKNKFVYIEIEDDGKGMNPEDIRQKAIEKGFLKEIEMKNLTKSQILNLVFLPGFSTAEKVSEVSGRGVGMDIVKNNITKLNGTVKIDSEVGKGTKMTIQLPITLSVARGLLIETQGEEYIIPIESIIETVKINFNNIHVFKGKSFTNLRGETIGVEWLSKVLLLEKFSCEKGEDNVNAVVISDSTQKLALIVDKLKSEQEFVVKTLSDYLSYIPGIAGSTLLGSGKVVLILNSADLIKMSSELQK